MRIIPCIFGMLPRGRGVTRTLLIVLALALSAGQPALADTVTLKNGNVVSGVITEETQTTVTVSTGVSEVSIPRDAIRTIERGFPTELILSRGERAVSQAINLISQDEMLQARQVIDDALRLLDKDLEGVDDVPQALTGLRQRLEGLRLQAIPRDPGELEAERLFQQALKHLDHVEYEGAIRSLREAAGHAPSRVDIQHRLAAVATTLKRDDEAIGAFRRVLELDAEGYYAEVAPKLLDVSRRRGRQLLAQRKPDEAVALFETVLLLEASYDGAPVNAATFLARRTARSRQTEEETLMEVYRYADANDLVDLAFAAITEVKQVNPANEEAARLYTHAKYLSDIKNALDSGLPGEAARIIAEAPEDVRSSDRVTEQVRKLAGDINRDLEAKALLEQASSSFDAGDYTSARDSARRVMTQYAGTEPVAKAAEIFRDSEFEIPVKQVLEQLAAHNKEARYNEAETLVAEALGNENIEKSRQYSSLIVFRNLIPKEREADGLWVLASSQLSREEFKAATDTLERLEKDFGETKAGRRAAEWLKDHRARLGREANRRSLIETNIFSFADPALWAAAADPGAARPRTLADLPAAARTVAQKNFDDMMALDAKAYKETRSSVLHLGAPIGGGLLVLLAVLLAMARPGRGKLRDPDPNGSHAPHPNECRDCGQHMESDDLACPACGTSRKLSEVEVERLEDEQRQAGFDPWDVRVHAATNNRFEEYFQKAQDLSQTSDVQAAIENCKKALHEDPHRKDGYQLLAELHERLNNHAEATKCYREILLIDPAEGTVRQKLGSKLDLTATPIEIGSLAVVLSALVWWTVFWLSVGIDGAGMLVRAGLSIVGFALTVAYLKKAQAGNHYEYVAKNPGLPDHGRPLPEKDLGWREQTKQAKLLANLITEHTGIEVPALTVGRFLFGLVLCLVLLGGLTWLAWVSHLPWALLAWPTGAALILYCVEIQPRIFTAHVLLRHCFEETMSPWADPHRPFKPRGHEKTVGEFLVEDTRALPAKWSLVPHPYHSNRQGVLNSIQQMLNRHWAFHHFYHGVHIVRDIAIPMPGGTKTLGALATLLIIGSIWAAWHVDLEARTRNSQYKEVLQIGYELLLSGDLPQAREYLTRAVRMRPRDVSPHLYLAHVEAAANRDVAAERSFRVSTTRRIKAPAAFNDFGNFLQREGRIRESIDRYREALTHDAKNDNIMNNLGSAHFKLREYQPAIDALRQAVALNPNHTRAWTTLGLSLEGAGNKPEAREAYERAVSIAPNVPYTQLARDRLAAGLRDDEGPLTLAGAGN